MRNLAEIIKSRAVPGILLFDMDDRLLYSNQEALDVLGVVDLQGTDRLTVPLGISQICRELKGALGTAKVSFVSPFLSTGKFYCSFRGVLLDSWIGSSPDKIMILIERVITKHEVDIETVRLEFKLTKREAEVVTFLCMGMGNREISEKMFISELTVKDHIKNVMKKMNVGSRNELITLLK